MDRGALSVLVALCVLLSGCSILGGEEIVRQEQAVNALADARTAANETETYHYTADLRIVASADGRTEQVEADLRGRVNVTDRRMAMNTSLQGETLATYVDDGTAYQECGNMARPWGVENVSTAGDWRTQSLMGRQLSLLESGSLYHNGTETIDGTEATILVGEPTTEALSRYQKRRSQNVADGANVENPTLRVWLNPDTGRLLQTRLRFEVTEGDASATATLTSRIDEYGEPVSITVPGEATRQEHEFPCPGS